MRENEGQKPEERTMDSAASPSALISPPETQVVPAPRRPLSADVLTARETQVLRLMAEGLSTKEIATTLHVTFKTAASHRSRILSKLGVHESISAVRWAIRIGLLEP
jgi:DNA-binding NarL/FixJ family response regulator